MSKVDQALVAQGSSAANQSLVAAEKLAQRKTPSVWRTWLLPPFFSPQGFLQAAVVFTALWATAHFLGWRQNTTVISGTLPPGATGMGWPVLAGVAYALFYFMMVLIVPILLLAAAIFAGLLFWMKRNRWPATAASLRDNNSK